MGRRSGYLRSPIRILAAGGCSPRVVSPLPRAFFARDADVVARELLGATLRNGARAGRVVETEAYFGPPRAREDRADWPAALRRALARAGDRASHARMGPTQRNRLMFGEAGFAYVYLIYGMHECLNVTTGAPGDAQAVLLRAVEIPGEPRAGSGPGKLARALGVTRAWNGHDMTAPPLCFERGEAPRRIARSRRIGVAEGASHLLRFCDRDSPAVSGRPAASR